MNALFIIVNLCMKRCNIIDLISPAEAERLYMVGIIICSGPPNQFAISGVHVLSIFWPWLIILFFPGAF
mgnify:CR=1 FL=1